MSSSSLAKNGIIACPNALNTVLVQSVDRVRSNGEQRSLDFGQKRVQAKCLFYAMIFSMWEYCGRTLQGVSSQSARNSKAWALVVVTHQNSHCNADSDFGQKHQLSVSRINSRLTTSHSLYQQQHQTFAFKHARHCRQEAQLLPEEQDAQHSQDQEKRNCRKLPFI